MSNALDLYGSAFRDLINTQSWSGSGSIRERLKLNQENDWRFICAAMDVIGDSESAIENFLRFGLDGPTRYEDSGERYLRLYGLLSATYLQQEAIVELYRLMNVPKPQAAKDAVIALKIRRVRNQLASHSVSYKNYDSGQTEAFAPIRISLGGFHCQISSMTLDAPEAVDLKEALKENRKVLVNLMDQIYEKSYKTLFKGQQKRLSEHKEKLSDLRVAKNGGIVIYTPAGGKVTINTMAPR